MAKSRSKKRKLNHSQQHNESNNQNSKSTADNGNLTHEEIWDDSALLRSWDEAVAEYEFYHSIHAKGEDIDEVLEKYYASKEEVADEMVDDAEEGEVEDDGGDEEGEVLEENEMDQVRFEGGEGVTLNDQSKQPLRAVTNDANHGDMSKSTSASLPQPNGGTSSQSQPRIEGQDQTLENVKMAYYWAGYYSGLYDGQRQSQISVSTEIDTKFTSNTAGDSVITAAGANNV